MKFLLNRKADKTDFENLSQIKANKVDTELSFKWIDLIHKQLKQSLVLIIEILKVQVEYHSDASDGGNQSLNTKIFLFQQALLIG